MSVHCIPIREEIAVLEGMIETIDAQLQFESDPFRASDLRRRRRQVLSRLQNRRRALEDCEAADQPPGEVPPGFRSFGAEISQGLPAAELVAGKDTLVRVFLAVKQPELAPVASLFDAGDDGEAPDSLTAATHLMLDVPFITASFDHAELEIDGPGNARTVVIGDIGDGRFSNFDRSFSENDNANFYVDGGTFAEPGSYRFRVRYYRDGQLAGRAELGQREFLPTRDLRLLIVTEIWPMPTAAVTTLTDALAHVHRALPLRRGISALDGDLSAGLRYTFDPEPMNFRYPDWAPVRQRLDAFNAAQANAGRPDRAEHILTVRTQQPGEPPRGGVAEAGPGGRVSGVTLNTMPPADDVFGTLIAQELTHNFTGPEHTSEAAIDASSAFDLLNREAVTAPRSIMFGVYTGTPNEQGFLLPADWQTVREGLMSRSGTGSG